MKYLGNVVWWIFLSNSNSLIFFWIMIFLSIFSLNRKIIPNYYYPQFSAFLPWSCFSFTPSDPACEDWSWGNPEAAVPSLRFSDALSKQRRPEPGYRIHPALLQLPDSQPHLCQSRVWVWRFPLYFLCFDASAAASSTWRMKTIEFGTTVASPVRSLRWTQILCLLFRVTQCCSTGIRYLAKCWVIEFVEQEQLGFVHRKTFFQTEFQDVTIGVETASLNRVLSYIYWAIWPKKCRWFFKCQNSSTKITKPIVTSLTGSKRGSLSIRPLCVCVVLASYC